MELINTFYTWPEKKQRRFQLKLGMGLLIILSCLIILLLCFGIEILLVAIFVLPFLLTIMAPFYDVPTLVRKGKLKYYSLFLLAENPRNNKIKIHGGTLFDYFFTLPSGMNGNQRKKMILKEFLEGLLDISRSIPDDMIIEGTTYILNFRTAKKVGFSIVRTDLFQSFILVFNYFNLMISMSVVNRKLSFPKLRNIHTFRAKAEDILKHQAFIEGLITRLGSN